MTHPPGNITWTTENLHLLVTYIYQWCCCSHVSTPLQVMELFVDSKTKLEQCAVDLDEKQQR